MSGTMHLAFLLAYAFTARPVVRHPASLARSTRRVSNLQQVASAELEEELDVVVIGSGLGGLSCAGLLASQGLKVAVVEQHYEIGGCAHEFNVNMDGKPVPSELLERKPPPPLALLPLALLAPRLLHMQHSRPFL